MSYTAFPISHFTSQDLWWLGSRRTEEAGVTMLTLLCQAHTCWMIYDLHVLYIWSSLWVGCLKLLDFLVLLLALYPFSGLLYHTVYDLVILVLVTSCQ